MTNKIQSIGFLGLGLIGGSIAKAIRQYNKDIKILVYTRRKNPDLEKGCQDGVITSLHYEINEDFSDCDILFLCAPVLQNIEFLKQIKPFLKPTCILTDVGSVKGNIQTAVKQLGLEQQFIGGHPMAGSEKTGYTNATSHLLNDCYYLITPTESTSREQLSALTNILTYTGAHCVVLDASQHDDVTAAISHVPHIVAATLVNTVREHETSENYMRTFAAGGFKDITRIASSSPDMWESICLSNKESIDHFLSCYINNLIEFREEIKQGNGEQIREHFRTAGEYRNSIPEK